MILTPVNAGQPLHVSDLTLLDHADCREVNADPAGTSWKISLFMEYKEDKNDILKGVRGRGRGGGAARGIWCHRFWDKKRRIEEGAWP